MQHAWETLEGHDELSRKATLVILFERRRKPPAWGARPRIIVCHPGNIPSAPLRASKLIR